MKKLAKVLLAGLLVAGGCSNSGGSASGNTEKETVDAKEVYGCNVINVFSPGEYIDEDVIPNFEKQYNATVNYDLFDSNEMMYTKLQGGSSYDVLVPSDYMIERLLQENFLQELDLDSMENQDGFERQAMELAGSFDPDHVYAVPYFWGSVGIIYNKNNVDPQEVEEQGWEILRNTKYKGKIFMYDSQRDAFMIAFKALGYSMNTENEDEINKAFEWLKQLDDTMEPSYVTDEVIDAMINGEKDIAVVYSGDAAYIVSENEDMAFSEPHQGTNHWIDAMVMPKGAQCSGLANAFIDYISSYDVAYANSVAVGYTSPNAQVMDELSSEDGDFYENNAYLPREGYDKDEIFHYSEVLRQELGFLWNKVKN
ncbi:MAG: ABC transporter substrate-binding protein [Solobacterium sp.]|nr:ABC transporter substrate-binding protein [Solobacterium sp.]